MGRSHYSFKKRQKEIERKMKQEEKRQKKFGKDEESEELTTSLPVVDSVDTDTDADTPQP